MLRAGRWLLAITVFAVMLGVFEIGFRAAGYEPLHAIYTRPSIFWQYDAELGWNHEPGSQGIYRGPRPYPIEFENEIRINAQGLRGPDVGAKPAGGFRILFLGDSVVAGFEVAERETVVARVEQLLDRRFDFDIETINGGIRGYGTDQSYLYYKRDGKKLDPDLVIFHHSRNDLRNNMTLHRARRPFGKGAFALDKDGRLQLRGVPVPDYETCSQVAMNQRFEVEAIDSFLSRSVCSLEMRLSDRSALFTWVTNVLRRMPELVRILHKLGTTSREGEQAGVRWLGPGVAWAATDEDVAVRLTRALVIAMRDEVEASGARFVFWATRAELAALGQAALEAAALDIAATQRMVIGRLTTPFIFENDSHWNANGHRIMADVLAGMLEGRIRAQRANAAGSRSRSRGR